MIPSVEHLARTWSSIEELCASLTEDEWKRATACPGWSVQDNVAHLIDYESGALGDPRPEHSVAELPHLKNALGQANEIGVDWRRARSGAEVLAEFREVTARRLAQLQALGDDDLAQPVATPAGPGTAADMLRLRVMDTWSHEQDIRRALGRPGHDDGPAVFETIAYFTSLLPYVVGKRAGAPDGTLVLFDIAGGGEPITIEVVDGRARPAPDRTADDADLVLGTDAVTFAALVNGRITPADAEVRIQGDPGLAQRILGSLAVMP